MPIQVIQQQYDAAVLGVACIAMEAAGTPREQQYISVPETIYVPDPSTVPVYQKQYHRFRRLYAATRDLFHCEE